MTLPPRTGSSGSSRHTTSSRRAEAALVLFAKAPIAGQVKTRLCPPLTPDEAASLHGSFVLDSLERSKAAIQQQKLSLDRILACAPSAAHAFFKILGERHGVRLIDQVGDDLGARMDQAASTLFAEGYRRLLIVGTDLPSLPLSTYRDALAQLDRHPVVLGPALDGGYYLLGLTQPAPELFDRIPWSTAEALKATLARAEAAGLSVGQLQSWRDADTIEDLRFIIQEAKQDERRPKPQRQFSARTAGALQLIGQRLQARAQ
ncbi:Glycosyltransferase [Nitrospira tepida]|uniref:Glycosyltransferase n=1 Tax=Nitrospira tepida TaxID=2973512 RepID=A0AA86N245_9BACT|nr:Glycosyltransferase [Nitrospira tepida]